LARSASPAITAIKKKVEVTPTEATTRCVSQNAKMIASASRKSATPAASSATAANTMISATR
jgi:hypothetical protein